ncbi:MAG TPA: SMR family transporter [Paucimonas sp.]|nr:SMR family transporter [Paucimonas sp.]HJW54827.1 SMR family transporter [Burkholderiaceae bacterium]
MNEPWIALIAVLCNAGAQLSMKYAGAAPQPMDSIAFWLSPWLLAAIALYGLSFLLMVRVFAVNPLSIATPVMAGCTFLLVTLAGWLLLGESLGYQKLAGIGCIFFGIVLLARA